MTSDLRPKLVVPQEFWRNSPKARAVGPDTSRSGIVTVTILDVARLQLLPSRTEPISNPEAIGSCRAGQAQGVARQARGVQPAAIPEIPQQPTRTLRPIR